MTASTVEAMLIQALGLLLVLGATVRLARAIVTDLVGEWWVKRPIDNAMNRYAAKHQGKPTPWWWKYRSGLECPFCIGFWLGAVVLGTFMLWGSSPAWLFVAGALTLNEVAAHLGDLIGDFEEEQSE